jgi:hypothetical protein
MSGDKQPGRRITIRSVRRDPPDVRKLSRALIALAYAQAKAEAEAEAQAEWEAARKRPRKRGPHAA